MPLFAILLRPRDCPTPGAPAATRHVTNGQLKPQTAAGCFLPELDKTPCWFTSSTSDFLFVPSSDLECHDRPIQAHASPKTALLSQGRQDVSHAPQYNQFRTVSLTLAAADR